jgi:hypothetical protein
VAVEWEQWEGRIAGSRTDVVELTIDAVLGPSEGGSSGSFPGRDSEGIRRYVKPQNNKQGEQVVVTEYLVSEVGSLIGAPVCEVRPARIAPELIGHEVEGGVVLNDGIASASRAIHDATDLGALTHRTRDDNPRRQAGIFALWDWCWGDDGQWLYVETDEGMVYSHDHGFYLPPGGADWSADDLFSTGDQPHPLGDNPAGLNKAELSRLAAALKAIDSSSLLSVLSSVPTQWPVTDADLEAAGYFLERRAPSVAQRLMELHDKL